MVTTIELSKSVPVHRNADIEKEKKTTMEYKMHFSEFFTPKIYVPYI